MKKLFVIGLVLAFCIALPIYANAGQRVNEVASGTIDDDPVFVSSDAVKTYQRKAFLIEYDETEVGNSVSGTVNYRVSFDGTNWIPASWFDVDGGVTPQTSETFTEDTNYYMWVDNNAVAPFVDIGVNGINTDADDTIAVTITAITVE